MLCQICGERMQPETLVQLRRSLGGTISLQRHGWYCWTCRTSRGTEAVANTTPATALRLAARLHAGWRMLAKALDHWPGADRKRREAAARPQAGSPRPGRPRLAELPGGFG